MRGGSWVKKPCADSVISKRELTHTASYKPNSTGGCLLDTFVVIGILHSGGQNHDYRFGRSPHIQSYLLSDYELSRLRRSAVPGLPPEPLSLAGSHLQTPLW